MSPLGPALSPFPLSVDSASLFSGITPYTSAAPPELSGLTPEDVDLLDDVIRRAGSDATTFLVVFKAYNDVLQDRGMDAQEVHYYGKLLKLGTLRGQNWGEKWDSVKRQYGYDGGVRGPSAGSPASALLASRPNPRHSGLRGNAPQSPPSQMDEADSIPFEASADEGGAQYHLTPRQLRRPRSPLESQPSSKLSSDFESESLLSNAFDSSAHILHSTIKRSLRPWDAETSKVTESDMPSVFPSIPPSYRAAARDPIIRRPFMPALRSPPLTSSIVRARPFRQASIAKENKGNSLGEADAWDKIRMVKDEEEAAQFCEYKLLERGWNMWRRNFQRIRTTEQQVDEARDNVILQDKYQRWKARSASRFQILQRASHFADDRTLRRALRVWQQRLVQKKQADWRSDMRTRLKIVRANRDGRLQRDAWAKWRRAYQFQLSLQHYAERLVLHMYKRWKNRLYEVEHLEVLADEVSQRAVARTAENCWYFWKKAAELRSVEKIISERVNLRVMVEVTEVWKRRLRYNQVADAFRDVWLKRRSIRTWKAGHDRIRALEHRAAKHQARQDDLLLRAVSRVWKARERGKLLERVRSVRLLRNAWVTWTQRLRRNQEREELAVAFSTRPQSTASLNAFQTWRRVFLTHGNAASFAVTYHSAQLQYRMMFAWRLRLRATFKMIKQARKARKTLLARKHWALWMDRFAERRRAQAVQEFERRKLAKAFRAWATLARRTRQHRLAEQAVQKRVALRIKHVTLSYWTNRVIDLKLREIDVVQQHEADALRCAFQKWKMVWARHIEGLRLMESYQEVKRQDTVRHVFYCWLSAARNSRHRRIALQQKEDEIKQACILVAWDKWRDRFNDEKLRPLEYQILIARQKHLMLKFFKTWHAKTKSLPAIKFHASRIKAKFWEIWRAEMPRALSARKAREKDKKAVLARFMKQWTQAYQTKLALKAVARARYLRLPAPTPRPAVTPCRTSLTPLPSMALPRRTPRTDRLRSAPEAGPSRPTPTPASRPASVLLDKVAMVGRLPSRPRSDAGASEPRLRSVRRSRELSPAPSRVSFSGAMNVKSFAHARAPSSLGFGEGRSRLLYELKRVQDRSESPSERGRTREPP